MEDEIEEDLSSQPIIASQSQIVPETEDQLSVKKSTNKILLMVLIILLIVLILLGLAYVVFGQKFINNEKTDISSLRPTLESGRLVSSSRQQTAIVNTPTLEPKVSMPMLTYSLSYFDVDKAKNKALVRSGPIDSNIKEVIESTLARMKTSPAFIEPIAIVFIEKNSTSGTQPVGIYWKEKQILVAKISGEELGNAHYENKYIVLKSELSLTELETTFVHELGHIVQGVCTPDEMKAFMEIRNIPTSVVNSWYEFLKRGSQGAPPIAIGNWTVSPKEDFAEVFKNVFGKDDNSGGWNILTTYGPVTDDQRDWFIKNISPKFQ